MDHLSFISGILIWELLTKYFGFGRYEYRKNQSPSFSGPTSFRREKQDGKNPPSRSSSIKSGILELNPLKVLIFFYVAVRIRCTYTSFDEDFFLQMIVGGLSGS